MNVDRGEDLLGKVEMAFIFTLAFWPAALGAEVYISIIFTY